jgi:2-polyprenyl-3-methyl-5-hydroxy-6-metoxy-1,4-benzoquinol methylase
MIPSPELPQDKVGLRQNERPGGRTFRRPPFHLSDIWKAPLNDFPIRDEILYQYLPLSKNMDVLEIGPGSGLTAFRLARQVRSLTLMDVAAKSVARLSKRLQSLANVSCVCADPGGSPFAPELKREFDVVFGLDVFEYVVDPAACLQNVAQMLRPSGELFLTFPNVSPPAGDGVTYFTNLTQLTDMLRRAEFRQWAIFAVRLRPLAELVYSVAHQFPLRVYRRLRRGNPNGRPHTYEETWSFRQLESCERFRMPLHVLWYLLGHAMRLRGDIFAAEVAVNRILGRQLVIHAVK